MPRHPIAAVLTVMALLVSACALDATQPAPTIVPEAGASPAPDAAPGPAGEVVITFAAQEYERQVFEPLIERFNAENPDMRVQFVSLDEVLNYSGGGPPDFNTMIRRTVSAADTIATWGVSRDYVKHGFIRDLKPFMDADPAFDRADYYAGALSGATIDGGIYLAPRSVQVRLLGYNRDLWAARGLDPPAPDWTWSQMMDAAEQLAEKQGATVQTYGFVDWSPEMTVLLAELSQAGISIFNQPNAEIRLDRPEMITALERVRSLVDSGAIYYVARELNASISSEEFAGLILEGRAGMWTRDLFFGGPDNRAPDFEIGTAAFPALPDAFWSGGGDGYLMSAGTQHPDAAWRWLSWLSRQPAQPPFMGPDEIGRVPARRSVAEATGYWSKLDEEARAVVEAMLERPMPPPPEGASDGRFFEPLQKALAAVLNEDRPVEQALREAQATWEQTLAQSEATPQPTIDPAPIMVATPVPDVVPAGATQITFGSFSGNPAQLRQAARAFNQQNPSLYVQIKDVTGGNTPLTLPGVAGQVDCFSWWGGPDTRELTATLDLQPLIDADAAFDLTDYPPALLAPYRRGNALHGLPYAVSFRVLSYNQRLFEAAGVDPPRADWSLNEFVAAAQQLTSGQGDDKRYGYIAMGGQIGDLLFFIYQSGAQLTRGSGEAAQPNFTDPQVAQAISAYLELLRSASPHEKLDGYARGSFSDDTFQLIQSGRAAMWFDYGIGSQSMMFGSNNETVQVSIAPLPLGAGTLPPEEINTRGLHIAASTPRAAACWTWLKHLSTDISGLDGAFPARRSVVDSAAFQGQAPAGATDVYAAYRAALERAPAQPAAEPFYRSRIDWYWFFRAVDQALQGQQALERALAEAQTTTERFLACISGGVEGHVCARQVDPGYHGWQSGEPAGP